MELTFYLLFWSWFILVGASGLPENYNDSPMHPRVSLNKGDVKNLKINPMEEDAEYWKQLGKERVKMLVKQQLNTNKAKNVIFFLGDGMSIPTLAAARTYKGQLEGRSGEESQLSFEEFPVTGISKTYCVDRQVAESACTATAYLGGVKANAGTIGVSAKVSRHNCTKMQDNSTYVYSLAKLFTDNGRSAGVVTTTRVTDASPAGTYAHTANRDWESDADVVNAGYDPIICRDIAHQLIHGDPGQEFKVILGGGRREMIPSTTVDEEGYKGKRVDGRNLIKEWQEKKSVSNKTFEYVWNKAQLLDVSNETEYLLGLFEADDCKYHLEADQEMEPSFEEMVETAINILSKDAEGFFLFAEGGKIDHAHHATRAKLALDETLEFSKGIAKAVSMMDSKDTLIIVTSDHAHTMSISGNPSRGNLITGIVDLQKASDGLPYMTLNYANGPGYRKEVDGNRVDVTQENIDDHRFLSPALVPLGSETHGGDDVGVFAYGPWQHLFTGVYEQSSIPHLITYATCLDDELSHCKIN